MKEPIIIQVERATLTPVKRVKQPNRKRRELDAGEKEFGVCPICRYTDGFLNDGPHYYFVCHEHKLRWYGDSDLFLDCWSQSEDVWQKNREVIGDYKDAAPYKYVSLRDR